MRTALISSGLRPRKAPARRAAAPETIGAAPEVPPKAALSVPVPTTAEMDAPGAPISGLSRFSMDGPREDDPTTPPTSDTVDDEDTVTLTGAAMLAIIASRSEFWMTRVGTKVSPPP